MILGAAYMLWLYRRVIFGELTKENLKSITDLNWREVGVFAPLVALALFMGIYPKPILDVLHASVVHLMSQTQLARVVTPEALELAGALPMVAALR
jgi:NADH-quinone oxidoreductase subunit M